MAFIPTDKMRKLREAAKNGDERARKILRCQMDNEDFAPLMNEYFNEGKPTPEATTEEAANGELEKSRLQLFLESNGIKEGDQDYEGAVEDFYREFPDEKRPAEGEVPEKVPEKDECSECIEALIQKKYKAIEDCDKAISAMSRSDGDGDSVRGRMSVLEAIRRDEYEHIDKLKRLMPEKGQ